MELQVMKGELEYLMSASGVLTDLVNQWVAVVDDKIVAHGTSAKEVFSSAKKQFPERIPFVMKVPSDTVMVM